MVDRQERQQQQQRMGEIPEWEGPEREEGGGASWGGERRSGRVEAPLHDDDGRLVRNTRGSREGVMRSVSGKSVERGARKEVRWSKDVDYEG